MEPIRSLGKGQGVASFGQPLLKSALLTHDAPTDHTAKSFGAGSITGSEDRSPEAFPSRSCALSNSRTSCLFSQRRVLFWQRMSMIFARLCEQSCVFPLLLGLHQSSAVTTSPRFHPASRLLGSVVAHYPGPATVLTRLVSAMVVLSAAVCTKAGKGEPISIAIDCNVYLASNLSSLLIILQLSLPDNS
jgi:hypothetical protein